MTDGQPLESGVCLLFCECMSSTLSYGYGEAVCCILFSVEPPLRGWHEGELKATDALCGDVNNNEEPRLWSH